MANAVKPLHLWKMRKLFFT